MALSACIDDALRGIACFGLRALRFFARTRADDPLLTHALSPGRRRSRRGFTLAEVLAATTIGGFVALVAVGSLKTTSSSASAVQDRSDRAADLRFVARQVAMDLANVYRDAEPNQMKLVGGLESSGFSEQSYMTFWTIHHDKVRDGQPEGDLYEVEYYVTHKDERALLMRRAWPHPMRDVEPGGVLTVLSDQVDLLSVQYFDGQKWAGEWPETAQQLPLMVEVRLVGQAPEGTVPFQESFLVTITPTAVAQAQTVQASSEEAGSEVQGQGMMPSAGGGG